MRPRQADHAILLSRRITAETTNATISPKENTQTGVLTQPMLAAIFARARELAEK